MNTDQKSRLSAILQSHQSELLAEWVTHQLAATTLRPDLMRESELREQSREFLIALRSAVQHASTGDIMSSDWSAVRDLLAGISRSRAKLGFSPSETATFVFSLK